MEEYDEIRHRIAKLAFSAFVDARECQANSKNKVCYPFDMDKCVECLAGQIISLETPTLRIAVVRKEAEFPTGPAFYDDWGGQSGLAGYKRAKEDMLSAGFVQEVKHDDR